MDSLPPLCIELIAAAIVADEWWGSAAQGVGGKRHRYFVARDVGRFASVGDPSFSRLAVEVWEQVAPGAVAAVTDAHAAALVAHARFVGECAGLLAAAEAEPEAVAPSCAADETAALPELKAACKAMGLRVSGSKASLRESMRLRVTERNCARLERIAALERRRDGGPPVLDATRVWAHVREQAMAETHAYAAKRITASTARAEHGLSERDLADLECALVKNPHYGCAAPMRLYSWLEVVAKSRAKRVAKRVAAAEAAAAAAAEAKLKAAKKDKKAAAAAVKGLSDAVKREKKKADEQ
jgi:hypothetical protein